MVAQPEVSPLVRAARSIAEGDDAATAAAMEAMVGEDTDAISTALAAAPVVGVASAILDHHGWPATAAKLARLTAKLATWVLAHSTKETTAGQ